MRLRIGNANLFRLCRSRLRTMPFDFHACCFIDHLHCCFYPFRPSHTPHPSIYLCYARSLYIDLAAILPQEFNRTHSQFFPPAHLHTNRRSFLVSLHLCSCSRNFVFCSLFRLHVYVCPNPSHLRLRCTPFCWQVFISSILYLPPLVHFVPRR